LLQSENWNKEAFLVDDKVRDLFGRVRSAAQTVGAAAEGAARSAGRMAGNAVDLSKLNLQVRELNADVATLLRDAGQIIYDAHLGAETDDAMLAQILEQLDLKNAQIMELRVRMDAIKNQQRCPSCGAPCGNDDHFCKSCGAIL
jgi:rRNA maturation endonuclease Nob1